MKLHLLAGAAIVAMSSATGASAQDWDGWLKGWYVAGDVGYHWPESIEGTSDTAGSDGVKYKWNFGSKDDWAGFARLGYRFNPNWRAELEYGYRPGDVTSIRGNASAAQPIGLCTPGVARSAGSPACGDINGSIVANTVMANVLYDFLPGSQWRPFIGEVGAVIGPWAGATEEKTEAGE